MASLDYEFGNSPVYDAESWVMSVKNIEYPFDVPPRGHFPGHELMTAQISLQAPQIDHAVYKQNLQDINRTFGIITDPKTGQTFEVARANVNESSNVYDLELSTYSSSLSGNAGNAVELAENAAVHPEAQRLYVASFGNGGSSYWNAKEQAYIRRTGRFTQPNGEPLPTIEAQARALKAADFIVQRVSANSAGTAYGTALMAALPEGQVERAYFKGRTNISNHQHPLSWGARMLLGDILDDKKLRSLSQDPWRLTGELIDQAKDQLPNLYSKEAKNRYQSLTQKAKTSHTPFKLLTDLVALSRGSVAYYDPAARDTVEALKHQPDALVTYHFPRGDRLYNSLTDIKVFLDATYDIGRTTTHSLFPAQIEALLLPGRHRDHTHYPRLRWAVEKYAFSRTVDLDKII